MKAILVNLELSPVLDSVLRSALLVAQRFDGCIEGLHVRPLQPDVIAAGADGFIAAAPDIVAGFERETKERAEQATAAFERFMAENHLPRFAETEAAHLSADWRIEIGSGPGVLGSIARIYDLIVTGRPLRESITPSMAALESVLFESGRLLLIAPPKPPASIGERMVIARNGSTETARTIAMSRSFLDQTRKVTVLTVQGGSVPGPSGEALARNLRRRGLDADYLEVAPGSRSVGQAILEESAKLGCDLLIKGAYTQSRLRQMIFGGATSHILAESELPVLMAH
jgi:nucleotide-binding universal stress UspA family protein